MPVALAPEPDWCSKSIQDASFQWPQPQGPPSLSHLYQTLARCLQLAPLQQVQATVSTDLLVRGEYPTSRAVIYITPCSLPAFITCPHAQGFLCRYGWPGCQKKIQGAVKTVCAHRYYFRLISDMVGTQNRVYALLCHWLTFIIVRKSLKLLNLQSPSEKRG